jgi:hypothetical protein
MVALDCRDLQRFTESLDASIVNHHSSVFCERLEYLIPFFTAKTQRGRTAPTKVAPIRPALKRSAISFGERRCQFLDPRRKH